MTISNEALVQGLRIEASAALACAARDKGEWGEWGEGMRLIGLKCEAAADAIEGLTSRIPADCRWYDNVGNETFSYFTSCGAQIGHSDSSWKHCPHCGGSLTWPSKRPL